MLRRHKGFTLIEVLVSLFVLGAGLMLWMQMMSQAVRLNQRSQNLTLAVLLAQEKMEEAFFQDGDNAFKREGVYFRFRWQRQFVALPLEEVGLKEVRVTVFWKERERDRQLELISYMETVR